MSALTLGIYGIITAVVCSVIYILCYVKTANTIVNSTFGNSGGTSFFIVIPLILSAVGAFIGWWVGVISLVVALLQYLQVL